MDGDKLTFYALLVGSGIFFIKLKFGANLEMISGVASWFDILMLALVPTVVSCVAMVWAVHNVGSTVTAILGALEPLTAVFVGIVVFHEPLTVNMAVGIFMIILAVIVIILGKSFNMSLASIKALAHKLTQK